MNNWLGKAATAVAVTAALAGAAAGCGTVPADSAGAGRSDGAGLPAATPGGPPPAGSGQPAGGHAATAGSDALCADPSAAQNATVTHLGALHSYSPYGVSQSGIIVGAAKTRWLARQLCGLPIMPQGRQDCPIEVPNEYQIVFTVAGRVLPVVTVRTTGCRQVTGLGPVRWAAYNEGLIQELTRLAGAGPLHGGPVLPILPHSSVSTTAGRL